jgi:hypothetical protein
MANDSFKKRIRRLQKKKDDVATVRCAPRVIALIHRIEIGYSSDILGSYSRSSV